ncbi:exodeoxyribonuclease VII small subunit [Kineococcus esterisolvens]|uniref:exodeoxyribonuclease VII small subunit n=1 Tax=unclassified Kineococcus TaxID=2621656 RepID=UPI003D7DE1A0
MPTKREKPETPGETPETPGETPELPADVAALGYEEAREELVDVVRRLEAGGSGLEESLALWERGEALATACERWLEGARARLDAARPDGDDPAA